MAALSHYGLYVHVPFCLSKCAYCGFFSQSPDADSCTAYLRHLSREMDARLPPADAARVHTIFIGGGNPTALPPRLLSDLLETLRQRLSESLIEEWTIETNPETLTAEIAAILRPVPRLRLSIGLQRLRDDELERLGRRARAEQGCHALEAALSMTDNVGVDLILGVPGLPSLADDLERLLDRFPLSHVSAYFLTAEPGTPLAREVEQGRFPDPAECGPEELYEVGDTLARHGLRQYEISNFARAGRECRHNLHYWHQGDYLGLGPAAVSTIDRVRTANPESIAEWVAGRTRAEPLSLLDRQREYLMLRLRLTQEGFSPDRYSSLFHVDTDDLVRKLDRFAADGLLIKREGCYRLSRQGMAVANRLIADLF